MGHDDHLSLPFNVFGVRTGPCQRAVAHAALALPGGPSFRILVDVLVHRAEAVAVVPTKSKLP